MSQTNTFKTTLEFRFNLFAKLTQFFVRSFWENYIGAFQSLKSLKKCNKCAQKLILCCNDWSKTL